ncbi:MAG: hypothetical protein IKV94_02335 [Clostridia bacterium]|nr:hypothetical protein [Clostridia bacterium]
MGKLVLTLNGLVENSFSLDMRKEFFARNNLSGATERLEFRCEANCYFISKGLIGFSTDGTKLYLIPEFKGAEELLERLGFDKQLCYVPFSVLVHEPLDIEKRDIWREVKSKSKEIMYAKF